MRLSLVLATLLSLAVAGLAATAPAAAQGAGPQYNVVISLAPPTDPLTKDAPRALLEGRVDFIGDPTAQLNLHGIPVRYEVTKAPAWASVTISPAHDVIPLTSNGLHVTGSRGFTVSVIASEGAPAGVDVIEIAATVSPSTPQTPPKSAAQAVPVQFVRHEAEECPEEDHLAAYATFAAQPPAAAPAPQEDDEDLTVQSGAATPVATWYALGGFGLAGAAAGFALLRRRART